MAATTLRVTVTHYEDGETGGILDEGVEFPAEWAICGGCRGNGKRANPNVDGHGLTAEDFAEDPDFKESYFSGVYDITCSDCDGLGRIKVIAEDECKGELARLLELHRQCEEERARCDAEDRMTRRWESGQW